MSSFLDTAVDAAKQAGALIRDNYESDLKVNVLEEHDIKIELDVRSQRLISEIILKAHPDHSILGEEEGTDEGNPDSEYRWVVDPIDGTVNFYFGIPHFCVSIALQHRGETIVGVVYDPMRDELFTVAPDQPSMRNGEPISVSDRNTWEQAVITVGFSKTGEGMEAGIERFKRIAFKVRKTRMLGSAALGMAYIACGRLDAYIEEAVSLWDIAAGELLIQRAGGSVVRGELKGEKLDKFGVVSSNGNLPINELDL